MPKYKLSYYFDGHGEVEIKANTKEEATQMWHDGIFSDEEEYGEEYQIDEVQLIDN